MNIDVNVKEYASHVYPESFYLGFGATWEKSCRPAEGGAAKTTLGRKTMNYLDIIIPFVGGLGLFIDGMQIMAQGLENAAGNKMK